MTGKIGSQVCAALKAVPLASLSYLAEVKVYQVQINLGVGGWELGPGFRAVAAGLR